MNKTTALNKEKASEIENAVCEVFGCSVSEILGVSDTIFKKVVVFILHRLYNYDKRTIGTSYQMTYLYVPTVVDEMEFQLLVVSGFREKIIEVCNRINFQYDEKRIFAA